MQHGFRRGHHDDDVGAHQSRMHAKRDRAGGAQLDEVLAFDVVHFDVTVKASRELGRDERLELVVSCAAGETTRHEQRLVSGRNAEPLQLCDGGRDRSLTRVALRAR